MYNEFITILQDWQITLIVSTTVLIALYMFRKPLATRLKKDENETLQVVKEMNKNINVHINNSNIPFRKLVEDSLTELANQSKAMQKQIDKLDKDIGAVNKKINK